MKVLTVIGFTEQRKNVIGLANSFHSFFIGVSGQRKNMIGLANSFHSLLIGLSEQRKNVSGLANNLHKASNEKHSEWPKQLFGKNISCLLG